MQGRSSRELPALLGYPCSEEVVHRENLALLTSSHENEADHEGDETDRGSLRAELAARGRASSSGGGQAAGLQSL